MRPDAGPPPFTHVGIVGLGLIGGSVAAATRAVWPAARITALDRREVLARAVAENLIDHAAGAVGDLAEADLILLAAPVPAIIDALPAIAGLGSAAVITDVGSTKRHILRAAAAADLRSFVGGHPMAGSEESGLEHARADLFDGQPWLLVVPTPGVALDHVARLERFLAAFGARPRQLDADAHDRAIAYVSHLPQLLAVALMNVAGETVGASGLSMSGRALRDMTRLASSPASLWAGILGTNADYVAEAVAALIAALPAGPEPLRSGTWTAPSFSTAATWRSSLSK